MTDLKPMRDRTFEFGCAVVEEFRRQEPFDEAEGILWSELLKTQKSLAANTAESQGGQTRKDFLSKFQIALKEAREAFQLLRLLKATSPNRSRQLDMLLRQCDEIIAILVASLKTGRRNEDQFFVLCSSFFVVVLRSLFLVVVLSSSFLVLSSFTPSHPQSRP
jgi:four helix bundle protein